MRQREQAVSAKIVHIPEVESQRNATSSRGGIIVDAEGTRANHIAEIAITETMIERVKSRFDLRPRRLAGDTAISGNLCGTPTIAFAAG